MRCRTGFEGGREGGGGEGEMDPGGTRRREGGREGCVHAEGGGVEEEVEEGGGEGGMLVGWNCGRLNERGEVL
jgi:hypothetical protein